MQRGDNEFKNKNYKNAVKEYDNVIKIDPGYAEAYRKRAMANRARGSDKDSLRDFNKAIELDPDNETSTIDRSVLLAQLGRAEEALRDVNKALKPPNHDRTLYQAACTNALLNRPRRAVTLLAQAIQVGYKADKLATDPDLESIREIDDFQTIMRAYFLSNRNRLQQNSSSEGDLQ